MKEIAHIKRLSLWIFFIPFIAINTCLLISINHNFFDNTIFSVDHIGRSNFSIPYIDGSLSISRASRTYPQHLIFKPGMLITAALLIIYWRKNNVVNNSLNNQIDKKNFFMIFGIISAVFLMIHSIFLGIESNIAIIKLLRRVVLLGFIIFEIIAQALLVKELFKLKKKFDNYFNFKILKYKLYLVSILIFVAIISIPILIKSGNVHLKHGLEWNYFIGVILFYFLTYLLWKKN